MKKIIFLTLILTLMISACAAPTQIATTTPIPNTPLLTSTATATPVPTATLIPSATPTEVPVTYDTQTLAGMSPEQIMDSVPETAGYEKQYQGGFYVYYVNPNGELGAAYNLETGEKVEMPENLKSLTELPIKIENADSYPEVDVKDLPAFVAWLHYKYDAQAKNLKPYPFVKNNSKPTDINLHGNVAFFAKVENIDAFTQFLGMVKIMDNGRPLFWGNPRMIKDSEGNLRVLQAADAWGDEMNSPIPANKTYTFYAKNPTAKSIFQIAKFDTSVSAEEVCFGYSRGRWLVDRYDSCTKYMKKYYRKVEDEVRVIVNGGNFSNNLEKLPTFVVDDRETFHIGN